MSIHPRKCEKDAIRVDGGSGAVDGGSGAVDGDSGAVDGVRKTSTGITGAWSRVISI
jgi:hypothetical protein